MKPIKSIPTSHPNWIDEPEYFEQLKKSRRFGISFPVAFLLVLGLHCAGIAAIYAYSNTKPKKPAPVEVAGEKPPGPKSDAIVVQEWPQPDAEPKVVATPAPETIVQAKPAPDQKKVAKLEPKPVKNAAGPVKVAQAPKKNAHAVESDDEALRKKFLEVAGRIETVRQAVVETAAPVVTGAVPPVRDATTAATPVIQPQVATDTEMPVKRATLFAQSAPPAAPIPRASANQYTLAPGDNLYMVSRKLGVSYNELTKANGIRDPRQLRVGQTLKVPAVASL